MGNPTAASPGGFVAAPRGPKLSGANLVAAGILLSRISGLIRQRVFAHYFGNSDAGDAFYAALKIPNFLQNLFGEGVLSASFIPVYSNLKARGQHEDADRVASIIGSLLLLVTSILVLLGIILTPSLIDLIAPGFQGQKRDLTIRLVQILFPGTGLLVMSAWCLGVLNSHHKFFLSYAAPVIWNAAIIAALVFYGRGDPQNTLALHTAWGLVAGSALQFGIQLPNSLRLIRRLRPSFNWGFGPVRTVLRNFVPVVIARGVVQVSAYIDNVLASLLPTGAVSNLAYAQSIYLLPISLFGMSVSVAELPAMSSAQGTDEEIAAYLRKRINASLRRIAFFIVPSAAAMLALGDVIVSALYQSGQFDRASSLHVWGVLAGSTIGILASTLGRLYSSTFYSLKNARTPLNYALLRVLLTTVLGYICGLYVPRWLGIDVSWGTAGLTASAGVAGWLEFILLRRGIDARIGQTRISISYMARLWGSAILAAGLGYGLKRLIGHHHPILDAGAILLPFGIAYFGFTALLGIEESRRVMKRVTGAISK